MKREARETPAVRAARSVAHVFADPERFPWERLPRRVRSAAKRLVAPFVDRERSLRREIRKLRSLVRSGERSSMTDEVKEAVALRAWLDVFTARCARDPYEGTGVSASRMTRRAAEVADLAERLVRERLRDGPALSLDEVPEAEWVLRVAAEAARAVGIPDARVPTALEVLRTHLALRPESLKTFSRSTVELFFRSRPELGGSS